MRNRIMTGLAAAAALFMATPLWAHDGHGHWDHGRGHGYGHYKHFQPRAYTVVRERWVPAPVYAAPVYAAPVYPAPVYRAPAPGVHIVLPSLFIPLR